MRFISAFEWKEQTKQNNKRRNEATTAISFESNEMKQENYILHHMEQREKIHISFCIGFCRRRRRRFIVLLVDLVFVRIENIMAESGEWNW